MDHTLENGPLKKTDVVSSNAEIVESTDTSILQPAIPSTFSSLYSFQLYHLPTLDRSYQPKEVNMILVTYCLVLVTRRLQMQFVCFATKYWQTAPLQQQNYRGIWKKIAQQKKGKDISFF
ncbi:uncharacterized protein TNCV_4715901 [Trichonephila clavipes]|nr:uncharacterized protein TNCV_4715901 [Trichonephila clavipes]